MKHCLGAIYRLTRKGLIITEIMQLKIDEITVAKKYYIQRQYYESKDVT